MSVVVFAGGGMPLQKVLEAAVTLTNVTIARVFTDLVTDANIVRFCDKRGFTTADIKLLRSSAVNASVPDHDWFFSVNSTVIFSPEVLRRPRAGALNMHPGRLPDYAGLHTHQWAIRNGEIEFAATLHWMTETLDAGDIAFIKTFPVKAKETGISLFLKCLSAGAGLVTQALEHIAAGTPLPRLPQDLTRRHLYRAVDARDGTIDWRQSALAIERFVRAADYSPLVCPTYTPTTHLGAETLSVHKAEATELRQAAEPGQVISIVAGAITVAAGDGRALIISRCRDSRGKIITGDKDGDGAIEIVEGSRLS
ncbi:MAG TPA: formyltransferase family protein [Polyangia bacterium]|jgi:methionyl-tRNA formyltransferase|nr:formyltransferase family protein [Polyangia bacterium]